MHIPKLSNAAGWCKEVHHVKILARSAVDIIRVGSIMWEKRSGNSTPEQTYPAGFRDGISINWLGLPGPGVEYYKKHLEEMVKIAHGVGKLTSVSIAGFTPKETVLLAGLCIECSVDSVEWNCGCPNTVEKCSRKELSTSPICYSAVDMWAHLSQLATSFRGKRIFSPKLSPGMNDRQFTQALSAIANHPDIVQSVVFSNTIPNGYLEDEDGKPLIRGNSGRGGIGGKPLKPISLELIERATPILAACGIQTVGCGGVFTGTDMHDYATRGVVEVQVGTGFMGDENPRVFSDILEGYPDLVDA